MPIQGKIHRPGFMTRAFVATEMGVYLAKRDPAPFLIGGAALVGLVLLLKKRR
jgi:hypothetical protein